MAVEFQSATPATPPAATSIATDDVGGIQYQLFKLDKGAAGASSPVTDANPLPITVPSLPLPVGAATQFTLEDASTKLDVLTDIADGVTGIPPEFPVSVNITGNSNATVIPAPATEGEAIYVARAAIYNRTDDPLLVILQDGDAGPALTFPVPASFGGGTLVPFGVRGWRLTNETALRARTSSAAGDVQVNILEWYEAI